MDRFWGWHTPSVYNIIRSTRMIKSVWFSSKKRWQKQHTQLYCPWDLKKVIIYSVLHTVSKCSHLLHFAIIMFTIYPREFNTAKPAHFFRFRRDYSVLQSGSEYKLEASCQVACFVYYTHITEINNPFIFNNQTETVWFTWCTYTTQLRNFWIRNTARFERLSCS